MLFRFLEYSYEDPDDEHVGANYITGIKIDKHYDDFFAMLKKSIGMDIEVKDKWYTIDEIILHYNGGDDDAFCCNIYCIGY